MSIPKMAKAMDYIDDDLVSGAIEYKRTKKKNTWVKWGTMAACFVLIAVFGIGGFQSGLFGTRNETIDLENGDSITFVKGNVPMASLDMNMTSRVLDDEEIKLLFSDLPLTANAYFDTETHDIVGLEGKISNGRLVVSMNGVNLSDTIIEGDEHTSTIKGTNVNAGYFVTKANSKGIKTSIYYAEINIGKNNIYVEFAGTESERETLKRDLADSLQKLIGNGEFDLRKIQE